MKKLIIFIILILSVFRSNAQDTLWTNYQNSGEIRYIRFTADGKYLLTLQQDTIKKWNVSDGSLIHKSKLTLPSPYQWAIKSIDISSTGDTIYLGNDVVIVAYDLKSDSITHTKIFDLVALITNIDNSDCHIQTEYSGGCGGVNSSLSICSNFRSNLITVGLKNICLFDNGHFPVKIGFITQLDQNLNFIEVPKMGNSVLYLKNSPDGNCIVFEKYYNSGWYGSWGPSEYCYKIAYEGLYNGGIFFSTDRSYDEKKPNIKLLNFSNDSKLLAGVYDDSLLNVIYTPKNRIDYSIKLSELKAFPPTDLKFCQNNRYILNDLKYAGKTQGTYNVCVNLFDIESKQAIDTLMMYEGDGAVLAVSPDSLTVAAGTSDGFIYVFRPHTLSKTLKAYFNSDIVEGTIPKDVNFYDQSTGYVKNWSWDFGDGETSTEQNPKHLYNSSGLFTCRLIVSDGVISDTMIKVEYIKMHPLLKADFEGTPIIGVDSLTVNFIDKSIGDIISWHWDFGDGDTSNLPNPTHKYMFPGIYPVTLVIWNGNSFDTTLRRDYINIDYSFFSMSYFVSEKIIPSKDYSLEGFNFSETKQEGYITECLANKIIDFNNDEIDDYNNIIRFNRNLDTVWTKQLRGSSVPRFLCQMTDENYIMMGQKIKSIDTANVVKFDTNGNDIWLRSCTLAQSMVAGFDNDFILNGYFPVSGSPSLYDNYLYYFNSKGVFLIRNSINHLASNDYEVYVNKTKKGLFNNYITISNTREIFNNTNRYNFIINNISNLNKWNSLGIQIASDADITQLSTNQYILNVNMKDSTCLYGLDSNLNKTWYLTQPKGLTFHAITRLNNFLAVVAGDSAGYACYAIVSDIGKIIEQKVATNRLGSFNSVDVNKNGELLLCGYLWKNATTKSFYLAKTNPIGYLTVDNSKNISDSIINIYPNPSLGLINIEIDVTNQNKISSCIFNNLGNPIKELDNQHLQAGLNKLQWDGRTESGDYAQSGVYYLRIHFWNKTQTKMFVIMR